MTRPALFEEIKTRRVFEEICEQIRDRLAAGTLKPGDKLPAERDLATEFKVGRPAVREALRTLEQAGVLEFQKGTKGGAFIRDGNPSMLTQSLHDLLLVGRVSVENLAEARSLICGLVIEVACIRATEADFIAIEENISSIEASVDLYQRAEQGVLFFSLIAEATHNEVLVILINSLSDILRYIIDKTGRTARPELVPLRREILKSMRMRDPKKSKQSLEKYMESLNRGILRVKSDTTAKVKAVKRTA
jgi:DNA-binding FadR family transcriptional regulator